MTGLGLASAAPREREFMSAPVSAPKPPRVLALDGLRALAVMGVLAYHAGVGGAEGGLLGVDVFFVISGFLITSVLLVEHGRSGRISLSGFWRRRALRLLPALLITLGGVAVYSRWSNSVPGSQLRGDFLASLFYGANWHYIATARDYFSHYGAPSPLLHMWSLSVEEQFYVVWPVVAVLCLRRWGRRGLVGVAGAGAAASAGWTAALYLSGASVSRLYYGTDTRAQTLLLGALVAAVLAGRKLAPGPKRGIGVAGALGLIFLGWALHDVAGTGGFLYEGGFFLVAAAAAAVIADVALRPRARVARALSVRPLRYVGRISYGLYLYHWPLFQALDHDHTGLSGSGLLLLRLGITFTAAILSFHLVEEPIRTGRLLPGWEGLSAGAFGALSVTIALLVFTSQAAAAASTETASTSGVARLRPPPRSGAPGATPPPPVRAMVVGDSMAVTLAQGLGIQSRKWGVVVDSQAALGCDLDPETTVNITGQVGPAGQGCPDWRTHWAALVADTDPDVVAVGLGRFETADRLYRGRWVTVGDPTFDAHLQSELLQAVDTLSAGGARVVLLTLPYVAQTSDAPDGSVWPINRPSRTDAFNELLRSVAAERPGVASVFDLNATLSPRGYYTDYVDGVRVRSSDREHISIAGGELVRASLLPSLAQLGRAHADIRRHG